MAEEIVHLVNKYPIPPKSMCYHMRSISRLPNRIDVVSDDLRSLQDRSIFISVTFRLKALESLLLSGKIDHLKGYDEASNTPSLPEALYYAAGMTPLYQSGSDLYFEYDEIIDNLKKYNSVALFSEY